MYFTICPPHKIVHNWKMKVISNKIALKPERIRHDNKDIFEIIEGDFVKSYNQNRLKIPLCNQRFIRYCGSEFFALLISMSLLYNDLLEILYARYIKISNSIRINVTTKDRR